jgi:hypothetical protein
MLYMLLNSVVSRRDQLKVCSKRFGRRAGVAPRIMVNPLLDFLGFLSGGLGKLYAQSEAAQGCFNSKVLV